MTRASPDSLARASTRYLSVWRGANELTGANVTVWPEIVPALSPTTPVGTTSLGKRSVTTTLLSDSEPWLTTVIK